MGGEIGVESAPGKGSRFWFRIPAIGADTAQERLSNRKKQELSGVSLLLVTREDAIRTVVSEYVAALGGQVQFVATEQEAIAALDQVGCDHIIFDRHGADEEPLALLNRLRARSETGQIWMLQARDQGARSADCPFDGILPRPVTKSSIVKMCQLQRPSSQSDGAGGAVVQSAANRDIGQRLRVLVAEDNVPSQHVAKAMLGSAGYHVDTASDGHQVIQLAENEHYDVILMDVCMPGIDGLEATKIIRTMEHAKDIVIVALTADVTVEANFVEIGLDRHFHKPVEWDELLAFLGELDAAAVPLAELAPAE